MEAQRVRGSVLLSTLIFVAVIGAGILFIIQSVMLQKNMSERFIESIHSDIQDENELSRLEEKLEESEGCHFSECKLIQFVPDAFYQYPVTGVSYYSIQNNKLQSVYALREKFPTLHYSAPVIDISRFNKLNGYPVFGADPEHEGVRVYVTEGPKLRAYKHLPHNEMKLIYTIWESTPLGVPTLWHELLLVEKPEKKLLVVYDARTGAKISENKLYPFFQGEQIKLCMLAPMVLFNHSHENKRNIVIFQNNQMWVAETTLDYDRLGRRTLKL